MATMTTVRGTPNLTIAATQNTAPVYEFHCLYSHDLRKKKKLWHDGSLRYHTFNKRVMVYDESKNYIGDSHWREADELQEGAELKLDKGVLVDVGDRIGETQTDLAPLLEKRRPENASSPQRAPLRPIPLAATSRIAPGNPQARPKSLSDVLGISQGPIGRARFPAQSPFEKLRHPTGQSSHWEEPIAKKPRIGSDKESGGLRGESTQRREHPVKAPADSPMRRSGTSGTSSLQEKSRDMPTRQVIDISSEDEPASLSSSTPRAGSRVKTSARKASNSGDDHQQLPKTSIPPPGERTKTTPILRSNATRPKLAIAKPLSVAPIASFDTSSTRSMSSTGSSKSKLRLGVHKPRKKLLYKETLASSDRLDLRRQTQPCPSGSRQLPTRGQGVSRVRDCRPPKVSTFSDLGSDGGVGDVLVGNPGPSRQTYGQKQDLERDLAEVFARPSSPLFMHQSPDRVATAASESQSPHGSPLKPLGAASALSHSPKRAAAPHRGSDLAAPGAMTPVINGTLQPAPPSQLTILDQELMTPLPKFAVVPSEPQQTSPLRRPLGCVVSENDSPGYAPNQGSAESGALESHTVETVSTSNLLGQRALRSPAKLTKSLSDTAAKARVLQLPAARPGEEEDTEDRGPWSKAEAYLLFDWFPPGREKVVLDAGEELSTTRTVVKRGLLFDQVDAL
jgi:hypothetical protein